MADPPLHVENFPPGLRRRARVAAARQGRTLRALVIEAVEAACQAAEDTQPPEGISPPRGAL